MKRLPAAIAQHVLFYCDIDELYAVSETCRSLFVESEDVSRMILKQLQQKNSILLANVWLSEGTCRYRQLLRIIFQQRIVLIGGGSILEGDDSYRQSHQLDITAKKWSNLSSMSLRRGIFKTEAVTWMGLIVVVSGDDAESIGTMEAYNSMSDSWFDLPTLPCKLMFPAATSCDLELLVTGGLDRTTGEYSDKVYSLSPDLTTWIERANYSMLKPRYGHAASYCAGSLWIAGGQLAEPHSGYTATVERYDFSTKSWSSAPSMLQRRIWLRLEIINQVLYAIGGDVDDSGANPIPSIEKFCAEEKTWIHVTNFKVSRRFFSVTAVGSKLYIFGGRDAFYLPLKDWDAYDTVTRVWDSDAATVEANADMVDDPMDTSTRTIPKQSFYGGQAVALPPSTLKTWQSIF